MRVVLQQSLLCCCSPCFVCQGAEMWLFFISSLTVKRKKCCAVLFNINVIFDQVLWSLAKKGHDLVIWNGKPFRVGRGDWLLSLQSSSWIDNVRKGLSHPQSQSPFLTETFKHTHNSQLRLRKGPAWGDRGSTESQTHGVVLPPPGPRSGCWQGAPQLGPAGSAVLPRTKTQAQPP